MRDGCHGEQVSTRFGPFRSIVFGAKWPKWRHMTRALRGNVYRGWRRWELHNKKKNLLNVGERDELKSFGKFLLDSKVTRFRRLGTYVIGLDQGNPREQELLNCDHFKESWTKKKRKKNQTFFFSSRKPTEEIIPTV
jgi:hypothetical protein